MKSLAIALMAAGVAVTPAFAQQAAQPAPAAKTCKVQAGEKKLAGAALKSFSDKCASDAKSTCAKQAADKKLAGAAKSSFETKCVKDATGA
jgi:hypothetical protein